MDLRLAISKSAKYTPLWFLSEHVLQLDPNPHQNVPGPPAVTEFLRPSIQKCHIQPRCQGERIGHLVNEFISGGTVTS
jgi:hypothetical protein